MSADAKELAWVIRVHDVGEDAARRSREYDHGRGSIGWRSAILQAAAILDEFNVARKESAMSAFGQDQQGLEAKPASPVPKADAQDPSQGPSA